MSFQRPIMCYRNGPIASTVFVKIHHGSKQTVPWGLLYSMIRPERGKNLFFKGTIAFFSKICTLKNFLGPKEMILYFPQ